MNLITKTDPKTTKKATVDLVFRSPTINQLQIKTAPHDHLPIRLKDNTQKDNHLLQMKKWHNAKEGCMDIQ